MADTGESGAPLRVGDLRSAIADLPDDATICVEAPMEAMGWLLEAYAAPSDVVLEPWGTNPMMESTVGVLVLVIGEAPLIGSPEGGAT